MGFAVGKAAGGSDEGSGSGASPDLQDSPECDGRFRLPSLLF
jgi:hypothetical protein